MNNVSDFVKKALPLCLGSLGLVVLGYLGYRVVCWIISKCKKTENINHFANSLINKIGDLEISPEKINTGHGEYVVFHKLQNGEKKELSTSTFKNVYKILIENSPAALMSSGSKNAVEECANRNELIRAKIKKIDPTLEAVFIPRTLYELFFIRSCIKEDLKHGNICTELNPVTHKISLEHFENDEVKYQGYLGRRNDRKLKRKCWHLCYFTNAGDNEDAGVKAVAHRLNKKIVKALNPTSDGFTHKELSEFTEKEIEFLKFHYKNGLETVGGGDCVKPGPTTNFGTESTRGKIKPMGLRNDTDAQIIRNAITLECSKIAQSALFVYRGSDFQKDSCLRWDNDNTVHSLSYGSSLFAGCLYDAGATAFNYMRNGTNAYAIPLPLEHINDSPFYIPTTHTLTQLFGDGEVFHGRTKYYNGFDVKELRGIQGGANCSPHEGLKSTLSKEELIAQFRHYKNSAIQLK